MSSTSRLPHLHSATRATQLPSTVGAAVAATVLVMCAFCTEARADEKSQRADALFAEGQTLLQKGNVAEACAKMEQSYAIEPAQGTLLNMAYCHEKQGRIGLSYREFRRASARAAQEHDAARLRFAESKEAELEPRLVRIEWDVPAGTTITGVSIDGDSLAGSATRVFVEPGKHVIEVATAQSKQEKIVTVPSGSSAPLVVSVQFPNVPAPLAPKHDAPFTRDTPAAPPTSTRSIVGWTFVGVGAAAVGASIGFGLGTFSEKSSAERTCRGDICDAAGLEHGDRAHAFATVSTIALAVGAVAIGIGTYLVLTPRSAAVTASF